jgi:hypothetical protein
MVIQITNRCTMGCTHCMVNATPEGKDMDWKTYFQSLNKAKEWGIKFVAFSGGEPTEHELFEEFMMVAIEKSFPLFVVISNGSFLLDKEKKKNYLSKFQFQITNDIRYYPKRIPYFEHPNIFSWDIVQNELSNCTRVKINGLKPGFTKPKCFNIRSIFKKTLNKSFKDILNIYYDTLLKFCLPVIKPDGNIIIGECDLCKPIGNIYTPDNELIENIRNFKCNNCGCFDNMELFYRLYLGEV